MTRSFAPFLFIVALLAIGAPSKAQAEPGGEWVSRELAARDYKISAYEEDGVYYCSVTGEKIIDTQFKDGYVLITFEHEAPRFFMEKELFPDLVTKLKAIELGLSYTVLCIHSFFRDDWQQRYDAEHTVSARLLNIRPQARELAESPKGQFSNGKISQRK